MSNAWRRTGRLSGADAGHKAIQVWICQRCGLWHDRGKPRGCMQCGELAVFDHFHSTGEAKQWVRYQLLERAGDISKLRRQVPLSLMTIDPRGQPIQWGELVVDFAFTERGVDRYVDFKPVAGMSPDAALKIRCLQAQGIVVDIVTKNGEV